MATRVRARTYGSIRLGTLVWLIIGLIITFDQGYWHVDKWSGEFFAHLVAAVVATVLWPISLFYGWSLYHR
jgi:hypothetical protein